MREFAIPAERPWKYSPKECEPERDYRWDLRKDVTEGSASSMLIEYLRERVGEPVKLLDAMRAIGRSQHTASLLLETVQHHFPNHIIYELDADDKRVFGLEPTPVYIIAAPKAWWGI